LKNALTDSLKKADPLKSGRNGIISASALFSGKNNGVWIDLLFFILLGVLLGIRVQNFLTVNIHYIDSDQPFMWAGASDYAKGLFYEPRFYGQNYNSFMEALFAVPFMWCGLPVYYALPIATHFIFLFPVIFTASWLFAKKKKNHAVVVLASVLCLTPAFDIMVSLPRGFVNGAFFSSFFVLNVVDPNRMKAIFLNVFMVVLGYYVSPNSLLLSVPFVLWIFLHNYRNIRFYLLAIPAAALFVACYFVFDFFYAQHPDYVVYGFEHEFSWRYLLYNLTHPSEALAHIGFFTEENCIPLFIVLAGLTWLFYKHKRPALFVLVAFFIMLLFTFATGKSRDGALWPWYSFSRVYLCAPAFVYLFATVLPIGSVRHGVLVALLALSFGSFKLVSFNRQVAKHTDRSLWNGVHLVSLHSALDAIHFYGAACKKQGVDFFLVSNGFWLNTFLDYGGGAVDKDFPLTQESNSERRYWVRNKTKDAVISKFVFLSQNYDFDSLAVHQPDFKIERLDNFGLMLVSNNKLPMGEFIRYSRETELRAGGH